MSSKITVSRFVGLVFLVAALSSGTASAMSVGGTTPQGLKADGLRLQGIADRYAQMSGYTQKGLQADGPPSPGTSRQVRADEWVHAGRPQG